jgi:hypothetical protein
MPWPKKPHQNQSNVKVLLVLFYGKFTVHHESVPCGQTVNGHFYLEVMKRLRKAEQRKRPECWRNKTWMLHHDDAPAHTLLLIRDFWRSARQLPSPNHTDLALQTFFLCQTLKSTLKSHRCWMIDETEEHLLWDLCVIPQNTFQNWKKC